MKTKLSLLTLLFFICLTSCSESIPENTPCTYNFVFGLKISLIDAVTSNEVLTNVQVVAKEGSYEETLTNNNSVNLFWGAGERAGTYIIVVTSPDYETFTSSEIIVTENECHVITQELEFKLQPK